MPSIEAKLSALSKVADTLNRHDITWAAGGSFLLYANQIADEFADIDIMALESDIDEVRTLLDGQGIRTPANRSAQYGSRAFLEYQIDGVDFDVIAGFTILAEGKAHYFPLEEGMIEGYASIRGSSVPLHSLGEWKKYYKLMGKTEKAELIEKSKMTRRTS